MNHSFTFLSPSGDGQLRLGRLLRQQLKNSILLSHFLGCPGDIQSSNIIMSSLWVGLSLEVGKHSPLHIYRCCQLFRKICLGQWKWHEYMSSLKTLCGKLELTPHTWVRGAELKKVPEVITLCPWASSVRQTLCRLFPLSLWHHYLLDSMVCTCRIQQHLYIFIIYKSATRYA